MTFPLVREWLPQCGVDPSGLDFEALEEFVADLYEQNATVNLTAVPREEAEVRHLVDSLAILPLVEGGQSVLDIGTGAGFPAWMLAWAKPSLRVTAMDSTAKRLRFIERHPLPNLELMLSRAEDVSVPESFDVVTGRAVAPVSIQAEVSAGWVRVGGSFDPFRTVHERTWIECLDLSVLGLELGSCQEVVVGESVRLFPVFQKVSSTQPGYPRSWAEIKKKPLE